MIKTIALSAIALTLASCGTRSSPDPGPIEQPRPLDCDPLLAAPLEAEPPVLGTIVQPVTPVEVESTRAFLNGEAEARAWGRRGWDRAGLIQKTCAVALGVGAR